MRALILAAGLGERLRPLTNSKAKPAIEFLNIPMMAFPYHWLRPLDLTDVVFNTHHLPETIRHAAMQVVDASTKLHFTFEPKILGSGGGIWNARFELQGDDNFVVANGDGVILLEQIDKVREMLRFHIERNALATLLVCPLEGVGTQIPGVWMDSYGEVVQFGKGPAPAHTNCFHYASIMILNKRIWDYLPAGESNILYEVLQPQMKNGEKVYGFRVDEMKWFETGNVKDYLNATRTCLEYLRDGHRLSQGLQSVLASTRPASLFDGKHLHLISEAVGANEAIITGFAVVGEAAVLGKLAELKSCVVLPGAVVPAGERFSDTVITSS
jgi:mannose-1-phosphate guanylyltransferase